MLPDFKRENVGLVCFKNAPHEFDDAGSNDDAEHHRNPFAVPLQETLRLRRKHLERHCRPP